MEAAVSPAEASAAVAAAASSVSTASMQSALRRCLCSSIFLGLRSAARATSDCFCSTLQAVCSDFHPNIYFPFNCHAKAFAMSYYMDFELTVALLILGIGTLVFVVRRWINRQ